MCVVVFLFVSSCLLWSGINFDCFISVHCSLLSDFGCYSLLVLSCMLFHCVSFVLFWGVYSIIVSMCHALFVLFKLLKMSSTVFFSWSQRYYSAVMCVAFMCLLFLVIRWPVFVMCIIYDLLLWLWSPLPTTVPWVHHPPSPFWTATVDPNEKEA